MKNNVLAKPFEKRPDFKDRVGERFDIGEALDEIGMPWGSLELTSAAFDFFDEDGEERKPPKLALVRREPDGEAEGYWGLWFRNPGKPQAHFEAKRLFASSFEAVAAIGKTLRPHLIKVEP